MKNEKAQGKTQRQRKNADGTATRVKTKTKAKPKKASKTRRRTSSTKVGGRSIHSIKYDDVGDPPSETGRLVSYWFGQDIIPLYRRFRSGSKPMPASYQYWDHEWLMEHWGLRGWEFGNWATQEDRLNYVCAAGIGLYDLQTISGFRAKDMGLAKKVTLAIGARGKSPALAHFEPGTFAINLTRYRDNPSDEEIRLSGGLLQKYPKTARFLGTGGAGSLAHEYGHALDYFFGGFHDQDKDDFALSGGSSIRTHIKEDIAKGNGPRAMMEQIMHHLIWEDEAEKKKTKYYLNILNWMQDMGIKSTYYLRRNELFARLFEKYVGYELQSKGISNRFLHKEKYDRIIYVPDDLYKKVKPKMKRLMRLMKAMI